MRQLVRLAVELQEDDRACRARRVEQLPCEPAPVGDRLLARPARPPPLQVPHRAAARPVELDARRVAAERRQMRPLVRHHRPRVGAVARGVVARQHHQVAREPVRDGPIPVRPPAADVAEHACDTHVVAFARVRRHQK
eukprot:3089146-Prymnesium_polylepis.1